MRTPTPEDLEILGRTYSDPTCYECRGLGVRGTHSRVACPCVYIRIFKAAAARYHEYRYDLRVRNRLYRADFELTAKRTLTTRNYRLLRAFLFDGVEWSQLARELGSNRAQFYQWYNRMRSHVGAALVDRGVFPYSKYMDFGRSEWAMQLTEKVTLQDWRCDTLLHPIGPFPKREAPQPLYPPFTGRACFGRPIRACGDFRSRRASAA